MLALAGLMVLIPLTLDSQSLKPYNRSRVGLTALMSEGSKPAFMSGKAYGFNAGRFGLEASLDYFKSSGKDVESKSIVPRVNVSFSPLEQKAKIKPYVVAGVNFLSEFSTIDIPEFDVQDRVSNTKFGLEVGIGATMGDKIDGRLTYTMMPTSEDVKGMVTLTCGYNFKLGKK